MKYRNTSMHMEKIRRLSGCYRWFQKHLHAHGENLLSRSPMQSTTETPPCTWRKFRSSLLVSPLLRNTSMHMEKMQFFSISAKSTWKHLHAHGENSQKLTAGLKFMETPPCTWRKLSKVLSVCLSVRNTSMHMEKISLKRFK